jgi:hypothetical protein
MLDFRKRGAETVALRFGNVDRFRPLVVGLQFATQRAQPNLPVM